MARLLIGAFRDLGHEVTLASRHRAFLREALDQVSYEAILTSSKAECQRIRSEWDVSGAPDLWVCYHPYYKSPDLIGPPLCREYGIPWITVEASLSARRSVGHWSEFQARAMDAMRGARVNISVTARDAIGLHEIDPDIKVVRLAPFLAVDEFWDLEHTPIPNHLVSVAMMRPGDKLDSYRILSGALAFLQDRDWHLTIIGDGPARAAVEALFAEFPGHRITWAGERDAPAVMRALSEGAIFVWPGCGEAYGFVFLEAQAVGLPVVAMNVAGVSEVVAHGETGLLTPGGDLQRYAAAIRRLLTDASLRKTFGAAGRERIRTRHGLDAATNRLGEILNKWVWPRNA